MSTEDVVDGKTWQILQASPILHGAVDLDDLSVSDIFITQDSSAVLADAAISIGTELVCIISTMRTAANPSRGMAMANSKIRNVRSIFMNRIIDDVLSSDIEVFSWSSTRIKSAVWSSEGGSSFFLTTILGY